MTYERDQKSRIVVLDIETVSLDPQDPDGAKDAKTGRIACIGMLMDNGYELRSQMISDQDERRLLEQFWAAITNDDLLVGHSILGFDLLFIRQRSWILGVKPPVVVNLRKYYTDQVLDLMEMWTNWGYRFKGCGLDNIAQALGIEGGKTGHGSETTGLWYAGEFVKLFDYCMNDVWLAYQVYCKMHYLPAKPFQLPGIPMPVLTGDTRELVPIAAQQKGPETVRAAQAPLYVESSSSATVPQSQNGNGKSREAIFYRQQGGEVILSGKGTFQVKKAIKEGFGGRGQKVNEKPALYEWHMRPEKFDGFAQFCRGIGVPLQEFGDGTTRIRREA